jgi:LmbE family N-acetylglucosaminyl deacetylase
MIADTSLCNQRLTSGSEMRLQFEGERILVVVAHPDDAELLCAGTLARAQEDDAQVALCVMCQGDKGQPATPIADLAAVRRTELAAAAALLHADLYTTGVPDGTLAQHVPALSALLSVFRQFRPTLVLAHSASDYHADHRAASELAESVSWQSASRGMETAEPPLDEPPALWWMDTIGMQGFAPGFYVDISRHAELKHRMLACHASQLQRAGDGDFAPLDELMRAQYSTRGRQSGVAAAEAFRIHDVFKRARAW